MRVLRRTFGLLNLAVKVEIERVFFRLAGVLFLGKVFDWCVAGQNVDVELSCLVLGFNRFFESLSIALLITVQFGRLVLVFKTGLHLVLL